MESPPIVTPTETVPCKTKKTVKRLHKSSQQNEVQPHSSIFKEILFLYNPNNNKKIQRWKEQIRGEIIN